LFKKNFGTGGILEDEVRPRVEFENKHYDNYQSKRQQ